MDSRALNGDYLAAYGKKLVENGYNIVPIRRGSKAPGFDGWQKTASTARSVASWLANGHESSGVGILTTDTPAIDLDIYDDDMAAKVEALCIERFGALPVRVGQAPKRLLVFRTDTPFKKMKTGKFADEWNDLHEVEILGEGQQFVAYAIHKDTGMPYKWTTDAEPINTTVDDLPLLREDDMRALLVEIVALFEAEGWSRKTKGRAHIAGAQSTIDDDPMASDGLEVDISPEDLYNALMLVGDADDYDNWLQVGMALHNQFDGAQEGLDLWHEWSDTADNYEPEACDKKWPSFNDAGKGIKPVTARYILMKAKEAAGVVAAERAIALKGEFIEAKTQLEWEAAAQHVRHAELAPLARATLISFAGKRHLEITGEKIPLAEVRKALAYERVIDKDKVPNWLRGWVYDGTEDKFFNLDYKMSMSAQGFNYSYGRNAMTKADRIEGKSSPSVMPAELAMHVYEIPIVAGKRYAPGEEDVFVCEGVNVANSYASHLIPEIPAKLKPYELKAIERVKAHVAHLIELEAEQRILIDWLAWVVQNPGSIVKWAILLQGVEGDGKSFFGFLLRAVMGHTNVRMLNATVLESQFSGWSVGQCVTVIEEPRLHGENRYDVINKMKTFISNDVIEVHPKGGNPYNAKNTSNYFIPTNFKDAMPLSENGRRYCVLFSKWQDGESLREFVRDNPSYYADLYATLERAAPALRKWLIEHEVSDDFPAGGLAPSTSAHSYMVAASQPEAMRALNEIIAENTNVQISKDLVDATALPEALLGRDVDFVAGRILHSMLENAGYTFLGRIKLDSEYHRLWTKTPKLFMRNRELSTRLIRHYLKEREREVKYGDL